MKNSKLFPLLKARTVKVMFIFALVSSLLMIPWLDKHPKLIAVPILLGSIIVVILELKPPHRPDS
jgi:hypothetical protein